MVAGLTHRSAGFGILNANVIVGSASAIPRQLAEDALPALQFVQVSEVLPRRFSKAVQIGFRAWVETEPQNRVRTGRSPVEHEKVVLVDTGRDGFAPCVSQAMFEDQSIAFETEGLPVKIRVTSRVPYFMGKLDLLTGLVHGPLAGIDDFVSAELAKRTFVRPAKGAHSDLDERIARLGFVVAQSAAVGQELFYRSGDRVMKFRIVAIKPL